MIELALDWINRRYLQGERKQLQDKRGLAETRRIFREHIAEAVALGETLAGTDTAISAERLLHSIPSLSANAVVDARHYHKEHLLVELEALIGRLGRGAL